MTVCFVSIKDLWPHEETRPEKVRSTRKQLAHEGAVKSPLLADRSTKTILDGHHRCQALRELGLKAAPVYYVNYSEPSIKVRARENCPNSNITKREILDRALRQKLLPPKSTGHLCDVPSNPTTLTELFCAGLQRLNS